MEFKHPLNLVYLKGVTLISYVVFGALEGTAARIGADNQVDILQMELRELCIVIDKALTEVRSLMLFILAMDLLLSPVIAANIALAATAKLYDKAHRRLENLLIKHYQSKIDASASKSVKVAPYAEL